MERLFYSVFLTACLWGTVHLSNLAQVSSQTLQHHSTVTDWVQIWISKLEY